jgi:hypothetical protein
MNIMDAHVLIFEPEPYAGFTGLQNTVQTISNFLGSPIILTVDLLVACPKRSRVSAEQ